MGRKRSLQQIQELDYIYISELADLAAHVFSDPITWRVSRLKFYVEMGILDFYQEAQGLNRKFNRDISLARLKLISELKKEKHLSIDDIVAYFKKKNEADSQTSETLKPTFSPAIAGV